MFKNLFKPKATDCVAPMKGKVISLDNVKDPVFSEKTLGDGFAIEFNEGNVYSPVDGEIIMTFPTKHALGIKATDRNEYLIHLGLDTVNLKGEGFNLVVETGQVVKKGDLLVEVNHDFFKEHNVDMTSPVIVTNLKGRKVVLLKENEVVDKGEAGIFAIKV